MSSGVDSRDVVGMITSIKPWADQKLKGPRLNLPIKFEQKVTLRFVLDSGTISEIIGFKLNELLVSLGASYAKLIKEFVMHEKI